jgi:hypothetical protein
MATAPTRRPARAASAATPSTPGDPDPRELGLGPGEVVTFTTTEADEGSPWASTAETITVKVPAAVGVQVTDGALDDAHPGGRPDQVKLGRPAPPSVAAVIVVDEPRTNDDGLAEADARNGANTSTERVC